MWAILGIIAIAAFIIWFEVPQLAKKKLKKEMVVFFTLLSIGVGLSIAQSLHVHIPNPLDLITFIFKPVSDAVFGLLK
ncbi:hypothetical protein WD019_10745 [Fictibacillus sp. Mic-4]|uniref:hypothetical protein n=1 Tax=Fictibacillus sp. Mic-4 TaxID=3132826 RepID=UPI003CF7BDCA